ncbi:MAG: hypothetical protein PHX80_03605 [Candidatus Nanoarchaeia archaeon]|nr:hypothetical protein [Candidatus Nanoarchaeia archaeon]
MEIKYGIISDVHRDPRIVVPAIEVLKSQGSEKLVLNGDIGNSQEFVAFILESAGKSGLETYVQPGSHEKLEDFEPVIKYFQDKYSNLINVVDNQKINCDGHELVFLPGSDFRCGGQYSLSNNGIKSGIYQIDNDLVRIVNMNDLTKLVSNPDKTIIICHVPRKFDNMQYGVDMAEFGEVENDFDFQGDKIKKGSVFPIIPATQLFNAGCPIKLKKENRGNKDLEKIYKELGIRKAVNGHFHESGHRACNTYGDYVQPNQFVEELFWNYGYCDAGQTGILTVNDNKVKYSNINLQDYLK